MDTHSDSPSAMRIAGVMAIQATELLLMHRALVAWLVDRGAIEREAYDAFRERFSAEHRDAMTLELARSLLIDLMSPSPAPELPPASDLGQ